MSDERHFLAGLKALLLTQRRRQLWQRLRQPARLGTLRRVTPLSNEWGFERGTPVDRYYIEGLLAQHRKDIRGRVVEIKDSAYSDQFGEGVTQQDVLWISTHPTLAQPWWPT